MIDLVRLEDIIPNGAWVYAENLQLARDRWDQSSFEDGSWIEVVNMFSLGQFNYPMKYFLPDGNHRCYVAYFEKGIRQAKVSVKSVRDFRREDNWSPKEFKTCVQELKEVGISGIPDLKGRIKPGNWRTLWLRDYFLNK